VTPLGRYGFIVPSHLGPTGTPLVVPVAVATASGGTVTLQADSMPPPTWTTELHPHVGLTHSPPPFTTKTAKTTTKVAAYMPESLTTHLVYGGLDLGLFTVAAGVAAWRPVQLRWRASHPAIFRLH